MDILNKAIAFRFKRFICIFILLIFSCSTDAKNDFIYLCDYISSMEEKETFTSNNLEENYLDIQTHIDSSVTYGPEIREAFFGVSAVDPEKKYLTFKKVAEIVTNAEWSCEPLERFFITTRAFE